MRKTLILAAASLLLAACSTSGSSTPADPTTGTVAPTASTDGVVSAPAEEVAALREACASGEMQACDDLWFVAAPDSADKMFGGSCGETADPLQPAGTCVTGGEMLASPRMIARSLVFGEGMDASGRPAEGQQRTAGDLERAAKSFLGEERFSSWSTENVTLEGVDAVAETGCVTVISDAHEAVWHVRVVDGSVRAAPGPCNV